VTPPRSGDLQIAVYKSRRLGRRRSLSLSLCANRVIPSECEGPPDRLVDHTKFV